MAENRDADIGTAQDLAHSTPEARAAAVEKLMQRAAAAAPDPDTLTTREKLERGLVVREDVTVSTDHEPNLVWVGIGEKGQPRERKDDPPRSVHIGRIDVYFDDAATLALTGSRGVYSEHANLIITNVAGFRRPVKGGQK